MAFRGKQTLPLLLLLLYVVLAVANSCKNVKCDTGKECVELKSGPQCLEKGRQCIVCTKMMPLCGCKEGEQCVVHKQTCDECAYAECIADKQEEGDKLPPLPIIIEPMGPVSKMPPIPIDIEPAQMNGMRKPPSKEEPPRMPEGILKLPTEDTSDQVCVICKQSIPECTECIPEKEKCVLVPDTCHNCAWAGCINLEDGCLTNVPSVERLCSACRSQGKECQLKQPDNCREPPGVRCVDRKPDPCAKCTLNQECVVSNINGIPNKQCRDKKEKAQCPSSVPVCNCPGDECLYQHRTFDKCAKHFCQRGSVKCEKKPPTCKCPNMNECILEPRSPDSCDAYFCLPDCVPCAGDEEDTPCPCQEPSKCIWRARTCTFCGYYECSSS